MISWRYFSTCNIANKIIKIIVERVIMNWMTSGWHRALYSKQGKRKQMMHFPSHVPMDRKHQRKRIGECINMQQEKDHNHFKNENKR